MTTAALVGDAYAAFTEVLAGVTEEDSWAPTGCLGWAVRDLTQHCLTDAQRALVALHSPAGGPADRDAVTYWRDWAPDPAGAARGRRHTRVVSSMFLVWDQLRGLYQETAAALVDAASGAVAGALVATQGHVLTTADLLSTLCVEATVHHLDLTTDLPGAAGPSPTALQEVRRVLDALLGQPFPAHWTDERCARVATGRARPDATEAADLGDLVARLPVFS